MSVLAPLDKPPVVLVVEDDKVARENRVAALESVGCVPIPARSHAEALRALEQGPSIDLVLTDVRLARDPDEQCDASLRDRSGVALARHVRAHYAGVPVVGYSACFVEEELADAIHLFTVFLSKGALDYREIPKVGEQCRQLALAYRIERAEALAQRDLTIAVERLGERVDAVSASIGQIRRTMVTRERLEWRIVKVMTVVLTMLAAIATLVLALKGLA